MDKVVTEILKTFSENTIFELKLIEHIYDKLKSFDGVYVALKYMSEHGCDFDAFLKHLGKLPFESKSVVQITY